jgi:hypothetical protein
MGPHRLNPAVPKNFISNGDLIRSIVLGPRSRRTSLTSPRGAGAASVAGTGGEGVEEPSSSWSHRRSVFDAGAPPPPSPSTRNVTGGTGVEEPRRGGGVEQAGATAVLPLTSVVGALWWGMRKARPCTLFTGDARLLHF